MFDNNGSKIFVKNEKLEILLGYLCSKLNRLIFNSFIDHTVHAQVDEMKFIILPNLFWTIREKFTELINVIVNMQKQSPRYDYMTNEQVEIDKLVYQMYNLNEEDIKEVDDWFFRRYPKLARVIEEKMHIKTEKFMREDIEWALKAKDNAGKGD